MKGEREVKKIIAIVLAVLMVAMLAATGVSAQDDSNASAKATAQIDFLHVMSVAYTDDLNDFAFDFDYGAAVLNQTIKTANGKDLFIDVSLQSAVFTGTTVMSKKMERDTSNAAASVFLCVWIDKGTPDARLAFPGPVVYNARTQTLTAVLQGVVDLVDEGEGVYSLNITAPEEIGLFIGTMSANAFNFIVDDLSPGMHTVTVDAACASTAMNQEGCAASVAVIGLGSMTIEEVRMVKGEDAVPEWW
jgi:hypothetical protein